MFIDIAYFPLGASTGGVSPVSFSLSLCRSPVIISGVTIYPSMLCIYTGRARHTEGNLLVVLSFVRVLSLSIFPTSLLSNFFEKFLLLCTFFSRSRRSFDHAEARIGRLKVTVLSLYIGLLNTHDLSGRIRISPSRLPQCSLILHEEDPQIMRLFGKCTSFLQ